MNHSKFRLLLFCNNFHNKGGGYSCFRIEEAEAIKIGIATEGEKMRIQEINTQIALQRERREGVLSAIKTMNTVYDRMMQGQPEQQTQEQPQMPQQGMPQLPM